MGRCDFSCVGYGMTEREALRDAKDSAMEENGHHEGYSGDINSATSRIKSVCLVKPVPAKRCTVDKTKQEGTRKWKTVYVVCEAGFHSRHGNEVASRDTQGEALKFAKDYALKHNTTVTIDIQKVLDNGSTRVARITPNKATMGKWRFSGDARC